ncbi:hypothetical protein BASA81_008845 [Batrachochytrium salamandrivorans]|nr:hypothetical protein BASA81_008845 [Batrachochytrium salamandrivorans]
MPVCGICFLDCEEGEPQCDVCGVTAHESCSQFLPCELPPPSIATANSNHVFKVKHDDEFGMNLCGICQVQRKKKPEGAPPSNLFTCGLCFKPAGQGCLMPITGAGRHFAHVSCARFALQESSLVTITGARPFQCLEERECFICLVKRGVTTTCPMCIDPSETFHVVCALQQSNTKFAVHTLQPRGIVCKRKHDLDNNHPLLLGDLLGSMFCGVCLIGTIANVEKEWNKCDGCNVDIHVECSNGLEYCKLCQYPGSRGEPTKCKFCPHASTQLASMVENGGEYAHQVCALGNELYPATTIIGDKRCMLCQSNKGHLVDEQDGNVVHIICLAMACNEYRQQLALLHDRDSNSVIPKVKSTSVHACKAVPILTLDLSIGTGFRCIPRPVVKFKPQDVANVLNPMEQTFLEEWQTTRQLSPTPLVGLELTNDLQFRLRSAIAGAWRQTNSKPASHQAKHYTLPAGSLSSASKKRRTGHKSHLFDTNNLSQEYFTKANLSLGPLTMDDQPIDMGEAWHILEPYFRRLPNVDELVQHWHLQDRRGDDHLLDLDYSPLPLFTGEYELGEGLIPSFSLPLITNKQVIMATTKQQVDLFVQHGCILFNNVYAAVSERHSALWMYSSLKEQEIQGLCHAHYYTNGQVWVKITCKSEEAALGLLSMLTLPGIQTIVLIDYKTGERHSLRPDAKLRFVALAVTGMIPIVTSVFPLYTTSNDSTTGTLITDRIMEVQAQLELIKQRNDDEFHSIWLAKMSLVTDRMQTIRAQSITVDAPYLAKKRRVTEKIRLYERKLQLERSATCYYCHGEESLEQNPIVICGGSDCTFSGHQQCLKLDQIPDEEWFCDRCVFKRTGVRPPPKSPSHIPLLDRYKDLRGLRSRRSLTLEDKLKDAPPSTSSTTTQTVATVVEQRPTPKRIRAQPSAASAGPVQQTSCMCNSTNYVEGMLMLCCDDCSIWYHPECIHLKICPSGHENCVIYKQKHTMDLSNWRFKCPRCCHQSNPVLQRLQEPKPGEKEEEYVEPKSAGTVVEEDGDDEEERTVEEPPTTTTRSKRRNLEQQAAAAAVAVAATWVTPKRKSKKRKGW